MAAKYSDYAALAKLRLSSLVVFSAAVSYLYAANGTGGFNWSTFISVILGGFLVTASANGFNQVWERNSDKLMSRTADRPLPAGRMKQGEALIVSVTLGLAGLLVLAYRVNYLTAYFGLFSLISYAFIYTPFKTVSRWAVFVGAIPGAMPPLLGYVAFSDHFGLEPGILFLIQFVWQFTHFWAIAWVLDEDYKKANIRLLPAKEGATRTSAYWVMFTSILQIPVSLLLYYFNFVGEIYLVSAIVLGILGLYPAYILIRKCDIAAAKRVMFMGFLYLPVIQLIMLFNKL